ncbi:MAG: hypothetical protein AAGH76_08230 [Pseudomonadota bacterium]
MPNAYPVSIAGLVVVLTVAAWLPSAAVHADEKSAPETVDAVPATEVDASPAAAGEVASTTPATTTEEAATDVAVGAGDKAVNDAQRDEAIDEVVVTAEGNLTYLRRQIVRAENDFYKLFNELTTEDDFKIICKKEKRHGFTNMIVRKCKSKYEDSIAFDLTQRDRRMGSFERTSLPTTKQGEYEQRVAKRREEQLADMARILQENPEFQQKLVTLNEAKAKYDEVKKKK